MTARVDVLIVHYLTPELTSRAVAAVAGAGVAVRVWDNSGDCPPQSAATVEGTGENLFFAAANNRLFAAGEADLVLLLNPDVELAPEAVAELARRLDAAPECWGITPRLVGPGGLDQNYLHALPTLRGLLADRLPPLRPVFARAFRSYRCLDLDLRQSRSVEQPPAAALLLRRSEVAAAGGLFDETYPLFFNDVDLARRMRTKGGCLYAADLTAAHVGGASLRAAGRRSQPVGRMYDAALLAYAGRHLRGAWLLRAAVALRRVADRARGGWWSR